MTSKFIQWYPGHIAKAERQLTQSLKKIDLVIEVRDARIPLSTSHPHLKKWIINKKHLLVINRIDMISNEMKLSWDRWFKDKGINPYWCNAKLGTGVDQIKKLSINAGLEMNQRRLNRGMKERSVRALTLGFPNVGKSALINRLINKSVVKSARRAGITKTLRWVKIGDNLDLLDAPGVIPPKITNNFSAIKLAICDDIGQASYEPISICIEFIKILINLSKINIQSNKLPILESRYGVQFNKDLQDIDQWLEKASIRHTSGDIKRMSEKLLDDYRKKLLGEISLEYPA